MQQLRHPAVDLDHALAGVFRQRERGDHGAGAGDFIGGGREDGVARLDLAGMDQRLAVEAELQALTALRFEAGRVGDVVVDAVDRRQPLGACGGDGERQRGVERARARSRRGRAFPWRDR